MFILNQAVTYRNMSGIITFINDKYVIMETPAVEGRAAPRLVIYTQNYSEVQTEK